jgi:NitT/TauT family transport system substrate-binding protein
MNARFRISILLLLLGLLMTACAPRESDAPPDEVTVQLKWVHQAQFAGFYLAQERGYYAQENIAITFAEGGPGINPLEQVSKGEADFGVGAPDDILVRRSQGEPVVAIATIYRRSPIVFAAQADSGIKAPVDFLGSTVAVSGTIDLETQFRAMMNRLDLDIDQVEIVPHSYDLTRLYDREVDVIAVYLTGGVIRMRQEGAEVNLIWPSDYGIHMYADTLMTTDQMIAQNPELVTRFLRASLRGWRAAIEEPEAATEATLQYARETDSTLQVQMMAASVPLIHTGEDQIGWMRADIWAGMHDILLEQGLLDEAMDVNEVYTMEFLQEVYGTAP